MGNAVYGGLGWGNIFKCKLDSHLVLIKGYRSEAGRGRGPAERALRAF